MTNAARQAKRYVVSGRVQGVGFRYFVQRQAQALGLAGWVRNLPDGRVEAFIEGLPGQLARIETLLGEGPSMSRVESVESSDAAPSLATGFVIRG
jgi:acylphosphatase